MTSLKPTRSDPPPAISPPCGMDPPSLKPSLEDAIDKHGQPEIFNTDQSSQFTSNILISVLTELDPPSPRSPGDAHLGAGAPEETESASPSDTPRSAPAKPPRRGAPRDDPKCKGN